VVFSLPPTPAYGTDEYDAWSKSLEFIHYREQYRSIQNMATVYANDCMKAVDLLMSPEYMSDELRSRVSSHFLFSYVLNDLEPSEDMLESYCITSTVAKHGVSRIYRAIDEESYTRDGSSSIQMPVRAQHSVAFLPRMEQAKDKSGFTTAEVEISKMSIGDLDKSPDKSPYSSVKSSIKAPGSLYTMSTLVTPMAPSYNLPLSLKIVAAVVLNLSRDTEYLQEKAFHNCFQLTTNLATWVEHYGERLFILHSLGRVMSPSI
jgi:hypothetical protein